MAKTKKAIITVLAKPKPTGGPPTSGFRLTRPVAKKEPKRGY